MKKIMMPPSFQRSSADLVMDYLVGKKGMTPPRDFKPYSITNLAPNPTRDDAFTRKFKECMYQLCEEALTHSFTPGIEPGANPRPGKVNPEYMSLYEYFFGAGNIFSKSTTDQVMLKKQIDNFKIVIGRLVDSISEDLLAAKITGRKKLSRADFTDQIRDEKRFLFKLFIMNAVLSALQRVYEITPDDFDNFMKAAGEPVAATNTQHARNLISRWRSPEFRKAFVLSIKRLGSSIFKRVSLGSDFQELAQPFIVREPGEPESGSLGFMK